MLLMQHHVGLKQSIRIPGGSRDDAYRPMHERCGYVGIYCIWLRVAMRVRRRRGRATPPRNTSNRHEWVHARSNVGIRLSKNTRH